MKRETIIFEAARIGYTPDQVTSRAGALTVGDLIAYLEDYDEDDYIVISHDNGYTFGSLEPWTETEYED